MTIHTCVCVSEEACIYTDRIMEFTSFQASDDWSYWIRDGLYRVPNQCKT